MAAILIHNVDFPDPPLTFAKVTTLATLASLFDYSKHMLSMLITRYLDPKIKLRGYMIYKKLKSKNAIASTF